LNVGENVSEWVELAAFHQHLTFDMFYSFNIKKTEEGKFFKLLIKIDIIIHLYRIEWSLSLKIKEKYQEVIRNISKIN